MKKFNLDNLDRKIIGFDMDGSIDRTHTQDLFVIASQMGFTLIDVIEGNYLRLALQSEA